MIICGNDYSCFTPIARRRWIEGWRNKGEGITRRRKMERTRRTRVEWKYSLNVKEVRLIKPTNKCSLGINVRRSFAFSAPAAALCLPIHWRKMRDRPRRDLDFYLIFIETRDRQSNVCILWLYSVLLINAKHLFWEP